METIAIRSSRSPENPFERFLTLIESRIDDENDNTKSQDIILSLKGLRKAILLVERKFQDLKNKVNFPDQQLFIHSTFLSFLEEFFNFFEVMPYRHHSAVNFLCYNFLAITSILGSINPSNFNSKLRYLYKLALSKKIVRQVEAFKNLDKTNKNYGRNQDHIRDIILTEAKKNILSRFDTDCFKLPDQKVLALYNLKELSQKVSNQNIDDELESLFHLNKGDSHFEWQLKFRISSKTYRAKDISFLLFAFSSSLESIGKIKVDLESWGEGSRWATLKIKIFNEIAKLSLIDLFRLLFRQLEAIYCKKTNGEVKTSEYNAKMAQLKFEKELKEYEAKPNPETLKEEKEQERIEKYLEVQKEKNNLEYEQLVRELEIQKNEEELNHIRQMRNLVIEREKDEMQHQRLMREVELEERKHLQQAKAQELEHQQKIRAIELEKEREKIQQLKIENVNSIVELMTKGLTGISRSKIEIMLNDCIAANLDNISDDSQIPAPMDEIEAREEKIRKTDSFADQNEE